MSNPRRPRANHLAREPLLNELREAALRLLARREHSRRELALKLIRRGWSAENVESLIGELVEAGLQSDARFAESYARSRIERAYGPLRIRAELGERGVERAQIESTLNALSPDWQELAATWYRRRYGAEKPGSPREKARRLQVMARRGFTHEHLRHLFTPSQHDR